MARTYNAPHKIQCDDGAFYVVKPNHQDRQFANELLALALGSLLEVPMFDAALIDMPAAFIEVSPNLSQKYVPGIHFGSRVPTVPHFNFWNASPALIRSEIRNWEKFYRLTVFDELIANRDRAGNPGNFVALEAYSERPKYDFSAIDHGHAFTHQHWTSDELEAHIPEPVYPVFDVVRDLLVSRNSLVSNTTHVSSLADRFQNQVESARSGLNDRDCAAILHLLNERCAQLGNWVTSQDYVKHLPSLQ